MEAESVREAAAPTGAMAPAGPAPGEHAEPRSRRTRLLEATLLLAAALLFWRALTLPVTLAARAGVAGAPPAWLLTLDDAYIFVRYAQQAARGLPWQWNRGEPSTGASSALYPWLLVPAQWWTGSGVGQARGAGEGAGAAAAWERDLAAWSRWSRLVGVASLWALGLAGARALRAVRLPSPWPLAGGLCLLWSGPVGWGAVAGMESALNAALLVLAATLWMECARESGTASRARPVAAALAPREPEGGARAAWGAAGEATPGEAVPWGLLLTLALLPLARPENAALTGVAAVALAAGRRRAAPRWTAAVVLAPGALLAVCDRLATGMWAPAGAVAKSWLGLPFLPLAARLHSYLTVATRDLLPVYLGGKPTALWPPAGWLAVATAAAALWQAGAMAWRASRDGRPGPDDPGSPYGHASSSSSVRFADLAPLALAWLLLVALAPFSILLLWQEMRHHHGALALAWLLALAGAGRTVEWMHVRRSARRSVARDNGAHQEPALRSGALDGGARWQLAVLVVPLALLLGLPHWARETARATAQLYRGHARAAAWLAAHGHRETLLLTDAGLLALAHDGPAIDAIGLCSPDLTAASASGAGAVVESLARRRPLPEVAAVDPTLLHVPGLLGEPLLPGPRPAGEVTLLARLRRELLTGTAQAGRGLDLGHLPDERQFRLLWQPPPLPPHSTMALLLPAPPEAGAAAAPLALRGCRPLFGRLGVQLPAGVATVRVRATVLGPAPAGELLVGAGGHDGPRMAPPAVLSLKPDRWADLVVPVRGSEPYLWLARGGGAVPCVASLRF